MATTTTRTRVISQNKAVFVTPTGWKITESSLNEAEDLDTISGHQLHRIDTFSFDIDLASSRQDVREFGQLSRISTVRLSEIDPTLSFGYYLGNGENEYALGFKKFEGGSYSQMAANILSEVEGQKERNVFVTTVKEGEDAFTSDLNWTGWADQGYVDTVGFGNAFVSNYSVNFAVGEIPRVDVEMQASNVVFWTGTTQGLFNPSLNLDGERTHFGLTNLPTPSTGVMGHYVLRPHDITVAFYADGISQSGDLIGGVNFSEMPIQSCSIELPLGREVIDKLGAERAYAKPVQFPIDVTMSISALVNEFTSGTLENAINGTAGNNTTNIEVTIKNGSDIRDVFILSGAVLDSQGFSQGLDDNETVDLTFSAQIGGANTSDQGLFFSGAADDVNLTGINAAYIVSGSAAFDQPISIVGWVDASGSADGDAEEPDGEPDDDERNDPSPA